MPYVSIQSISKERGDCSNCRFSKQAAPYKVLLECALDMEGKLQPHTCDRWESAFLANPEYNQVSRED